MRPFKFSNEYECGDILVVDDNEFNIYALEKLLKKYNLKIDKAFNG